jgi:hypothetical protein
MKRNVLVVLAVLALVVLLAPPQASATGKFEVFAGYFFPEELDEDLTYGLRFGSKGDNNWGWEVAGSWFDVADSQGFSGQKVDADIVHVDFSAVYYPGGNDFGILFGLGWASGNVDVPGTTTDLSDDTFTVNGGIAYDINFTDSFYLRPDLRFRWYELEGFGPDGGKDSQLTYEAALALGWRFGG